MKAIHRLHDLCNERLQTIEFQEMVAFPMGRSSNSKDSCQEKPLKPSHSALACLAFSPACSRKHGEVARADLEELMEPSKSLHSASEMLGWAGSHSMLLPPVLIARRQGLHGHCFGLQPVPPWQDRSKLGLQLTVLAWQAAQAPGCNEKHPIRQCPLLLCYYILCSSTLPCTCRCPKNTQLREWCNA